MYIFHFCQKINEYLYNEKLPLHLKDKYLQYYNLKKIGKIKEYWENNVKITSLNNHLTFEYIQDISISYDTTKNLLIQEYNREKCPPYNFYQVNIEDVFTLYENKQNDILIRLKEYKDYITIEFHTSLFEKMDDINLF